MQSHAFRALCLALLTAIAVSVSSSSALAADNAAVATSDQSDGPVLGSVPVPQGLTANEVKGIVVRALLARRWIVQDKTDTKIVAHYERGKNVATIAVKYDTTTVEIAGTGSSRKGGVPMRWIENLKKDLGVFLGQAAANK